MAYGDLSNCSNRAVQSMRSNKRFFDRKFEAETSEPAMVKKLVPVAALSKNSLLCAR